MQNDFDYVEQSAVETVTKLAKAELLRYFTKLIFAFRTCSAYYFYVHSYQHSSSMNLNLSVEDIDSNAHRSNSALHVIKEINNFVKYLSDSAFANFVTVSTALCST